MVFHVLGNIFQFAFNSYLVSSLFETSCLCSSFHGLNGCVGVGSSYIGCGVVMVNSHMRVDGDAVGFVPLYGTGQDKRTFGSCVLVCCLFLGDWTLIGGL